MSKKNVELSSLPPKSDELTSPEGKQASIRPIVFCTLAFVLCILVSAAPLLRLAGTTLLLSLPTNPLLLLWGSWLPVDLHLASTSRASMITTNMIEFLLLMVLAFAAYGLCAYFIQRQPRQSDYKQVFGLIWWGVIAAGLIFVLTPAMLSRDIFVYAGYGRTIAAHHANPYFVAQATFPRDPLTSYDDWKYATAAYGPAWLTICALWALVSGGSPLAYVLAFRLFALAAHLVNTWLVAAILRKMGCSARTIALGTLLYAWNPLVLQESSLGGHNDIFMISLILLGILLCLRAEQQNFARRDLLPIIAFTLATLVKFTALPLIALFLVLLARKSLYSTHSVPLTNELHASPRWRHTLLKLLLAVATSALIAFIFYAPFWLGHSFHEIVQSFSSPPSAHNSENSLMRAIFEWIKLHGLPAHASWISTPLHVLSQREVWDRINYVTLCCILIIGAVWIWRFPTTRTMALAALATLGVLLIVTPWFFAWYVTWLIGLAAICLPAVKDRTGRALLAFALTFSGTAYLTYLFNGYPPIGGWSGLSWALMMGPPLLVFSFLIILNKKAWLRSLDNGATIAT